MRWLRSTRLAEVVGEVARARTLLAFDFDGTLAPLVEDRDRAAMRDETRALLRATALLYPCAVISGRARADVAARVDGIPLVAIVGCHGAEPGFGPLDRGLARRVAGWRDAVLRAVRGCDGIDVEDKRFGLAIHYRKARSWRAAERRAVAAARRLPGATVMGGHAVVNVVPADAPTKGDALTALCVRLGGRPVLYVGDDVTDEHAFRAGVVGVSIAIGIARDSAASYRLESQDQVDDLLRALICARAEQDGRGARWQGLVQAVRP